MSATEQSILVVRSVTNAMKGQKILENNGISAFVQRNMNPAGRQGCGYGIRITGDASYAVNLLTTAGIQVSEIQQGGAYYG